MAGIGGQTHGVFGWTKVGSTLVLMRPGSAFQMPRNLDEPVPINGAGGNGIINIGESVQFPVANIQGVALDNGAAGWLTAANLNAWFRTRSARPVWDLTELSAFLFSNNGSVGAGRGSWVGNNMKGMGFSLSCRKGQEIGFNLRFCGRSRVKAVSGDIPAATPTLTGAPLMFDRLSFPSATDLYQKGVTGITLDFNCNTTPNMELDGSIYPVEQNAGVPTARMTLELNSLDTVAPPGYDDTNDTWISLVNTQLLLNVVSGGSPVNITFTLGRVECITPFDVQGQPARVNRALTYNVYATTTNQPVLIA